MMGEFEKFCDEVERLVTGRGMTIAEIDEAMDLQGLTMEQTVILHQELCSQIAFESK